MQHIMFVILIMMSINTQVSADTENSISISDFKSVEIFKSKSCNCCNKYADILRKEGLIPLVKNTEAVRSIYVDLDIDPNFRACHMTVADGYLFSGHVPPEDIKEVLSSKPRIRGLLVPGMPAGSDGMEIDGYTDEEFIIYSLDFSGKIEPYRTHSPNNEISSEVTKIVIE